MHVGFRAGVAKNNPEQRAGWGSVAWGGAGRGCDVLSPPKLRRERVLGGLSCPSLLPVLQEQGKVPLRLCQSPADCSEQGLFLQKAVRINGGSEETLGVDSVPVLRLLGFCLKRVFLGGKCDPQVPES